MSAFCMTGLEVRGADDISFSWKEVFQSVPVPEYVPRHSIQFWVMYCPVEVGVPSSFGEGFRSLRMGKSMESE